MGRREFADLDFVAHAHAELQQERFFNDCAFAAHKPLPAFRRLRFGFTVVGKIARQRADLRRVACLRSWENRPLKKTALARSKRHRGYLEKPFAHRLIHRATAPSNPRRAMPFGLFFGGLLKIPPERADGDHRRDAEHDGR